MAKFLEDAGAVCEDTFELVPIVQKVLEGGLDLRHRLDGRYTRLPPRRRFALTAWGSNQHGQLGYGLKGKEEEWAPSPSFVDLDLWGPWPGLKQLASGGGHSAMVLANGRMYVWGWEAQGQVGVYHEEREGEGAPFLRPFPRLVTAVALGHAHTLILERDTGRVYGLGADGHGEASGAVGEGKEREAREEGGVHVACVRDPAVSVAAGVRHSAAITSQGEGEEYCC